MAGYELTELDEAGEMIHEIIISRNEQEAQDRVTRIDFIRPAQAVKSPFQTLLDVFLPAGFPHSVTSDYVEQDSLQAFASSIAGLLSSRAVLSSLGVGDASSSATAAVVLNVLQESLGRMSTILFAHRYGTVIEPECKMYRLLADVLNDCAFVLDCLSPALPQPFRIIALTSGGVLRALCGVAAGSSKACLSAHFAKWGNLAELNAKDSSQETVISLFGMLCGTLVVTTITGPAATWTVLMLLLALHLELNRRAVRAVAMNSMNRQRAGLVYHHLTRGKVPTPCDIAQQEEIFATADALRDVDRCYLGSCKIGVSLQTYFASLSTPTSSGSVKTNERAFSALLQPFSDMRHVLWYDVSPLSERLTVRIALKKGATNQDQVLAWWHASALACQISNARKTPDKHADKGGTILQRSLMEASDLMEKFEQPLRAAGWDIDGSKLETRSGVRLDVTNKSLR